MNTSLRVDAATSDGAPVQDTEGSDRYDNPSTPDTGGGSDPYYDSGAYEYRPSMGI